MHLHPADDLSTPTRPLSIAARLWVATGMINPHFANQVIVEGAGNFNVEQWRMAVHKASAANRGARLILRGCLASRRLVDSGLNPPIREVDGSSWDGRGSDGAPFLKEGLNPRKGPNCEVVLMQGNPARVAFRSHHAIMDGRGTMIWAEDIFRVLRGEEPLGSEYVMIENDLLNLQKGKWDKPIPRRYIAPTGKADGDAVDLVWKRKTITGKFPKLLARVMLLTAREAWRCGEGSIRIGVPTDLRQRCKGLRSTSNLTYALFIDIPKSATAEWIADEIARRFSGVSDGTISWENMIRYVPIRILARAIKSEGLRNGRSGRYRFSGFVSNLGKMDMTVYSCGDFTAHTYFLIPVCAPILPLSMTLSGSNNIIEMLLMMPRNMATGDRMEAILDSIGEGLATAG